MWIPIQPVITALSPSISGSARPSFTWEQETEDARTSLFCQLAFAVPITTWTSFKLSRLGVCLGPRLSCLGGCYQQKWNRTGGLSLAGSRHIPHVLRITCFWSLSLSHGKCTSSNLTFPFQTHQENKWRLCTPVAGGGTCWVTEGQAQSGIQSLLYPIKPNRIYHGGSFSLFITYGDTVAQGKQSTRFWHLRHFCTRQSILAGSDQYSSWF